MGPDSWGGVRLERMQALRPWRSVLFSPPSYPPNPKAITASLPEAAERDSHRECGFQVLFGGHIVWQMCDLGDGFPSSS